MGTCRSPYLEFLNLESTATVVITDSGGLQEETTILRVPCLTLRNNTERPVRFGNLPSLPSTGTAMPQSQLFALFAIFAFN
jgi:hypothetical protein